MGSEVIVAQPWQMCPLNSSLFPRISVVYDYRLASGPSRWLDASGPTWRASRCKRLADSVRMPLRLRLESRRIKELHGIDAR